MISRRQFLAGVGIASLAGCSGRESSSESISAVDGPVVAAPVPDDPDSRTYATMGSTDGPVVTYYGNWKCPYCAQFSSGFLADIVSEYVEPGDVAVEYRALTYVDGSPFLGPDAPRASRAGLAVWNVDPSAYWRYHELVMANQPPETQQWATTEKLMRFVSEAEVSDTETVRSEIESESYNEALEATTAAANEAGISSTPALRIGDEVVNPLQNEQRVRELIEAL